MKLNLKALIVCIAIPLAVGFLASLLTREGVEASALLKKPPLAPPDWLFPVVWTLLYTLMGFASYLVFTSGADQAQIKSALRIYAIQLAVNFLWSIVFFNLEWYFGAILIIFLLLLLIFMTKRAFRDISQTAGLLLIPYLIWVSFAAYLTIGIWILN